MSDPNFWLTRRAFVGTAAALAGSACLAGQAFGDTKPKNTPQNGAHDMSSGYVKTKADM
jgi:hypothetical protein